MSDEVKTIKVLEITGEPISHGGQEAFIVNVLSHMPEGDIRFDVLTPYYCDNERYREIISRRGELYALGLPFAPGKSRFNLLKPLEEFFKEHSYDVVHIHSGSISVLAECAHVAKKAGVRKIIVHSHCAVEKKTLKYRLVKLFFSRTLNSAPTHYAACSVLAGEAKFSRRICRGKLMILNNGVDTDEYAFSEEKRAEMRKALGVDDDCILLTHVGRFSCQKNQRFLLPVLGEIIRREKKAKLLLIGSGEEENDVKQACAQSGLDGNVIFTGNVDNVSDYLQAADVFMLPSRYEGLPIVGVEAQAAGLPCVFGNAVTAETAITENVRFLPIDDESAGTWADAAMSFAGRRFPENTEILKEKGYDIRETAERLMDIYRG